MFAVEVDNLRKEFRRSDGRSGLRRKRKRVPALRGVSFAMERGECVAVLGQNGSGKSTLVRLLSTLLLPDGGEARVFGHDVARESRAVRRLVNRVSVEAAFFKKMSAEENLAYAARFYGMTRKQTRHRIPEILADRVGILDRGRLICLEPADELKERYGSETLEDAFFAATGRAFQAEEEEEEKEVFA